MKKELYIAPQTKVYAVRSENLMDFGVSNTEAPGGGGFEFAKPGGGQQGTGGTQFQFRDVWED